MKKRSAIIMSLIAVLAVIAVMITVYVVFDKKPSAVGNVDGGAVKLTDAEQREIYYDAVGRLATIGSMRFDYSCTQRFTWPESSSEDKLTAQVKLLGRGGDDPRYSAEFTVDEEEGFTLAYSGGIGYSDESGSAYCSAMSEEDFTRWLYSHLLSDADRQYKKLSVTELSEGGYECTASGPDKLPESVQRTLFELGAENVKIDEYRKTARIDKLGRLSGETTYIKLSMKQWGKPVGAEIQCSVKYEGVGERFTLDEPEGDYTDIGDIRGPVLMSTAYDNFYNRSYTADYSSAFVYRYSGEEQGYSINLGYNTEVEQGRLFKAKDATTIDYNTKARTSEHERTTSCSGGVYAVTDDGEASSRKMDAETARGTYYYLLVDHRPDMADVSAVTVKDTGDRYEVDYLYTDEGARKLCQTVLTTMSEDTSGKAVNAENYIINVSRGVMMINKADGTLISHEIHVSAEFDGEVSVGFDHTLNMSVT